MLPFPVVASTVVLKSTCAAGAGFNPAPVVINEQRVIGSRCGPFDAALELLGARGGDLNVEKYISGTAFNSSCRCETNPSWDPFACLLAFDKKPIDQLFVLLSQAAGKRIAVPCCGESIFRTRPDPGLLYTCTARQTQQRCKAGRAPPAALLRYPQREKSRAHDETTTTCERHTRRAKPRVA